jgi:hypothetical protein
MTIHMRKEATIQLLIHVNKWLCIIKNELFEEKILFEMCLSLIIQRLSFKFTVIFDQAGEP